MCIYKVITICSYIIVTCVAIYGVFAVIKSY